LGAIRRSRANARKILMVACAPDFDPLAIEKKPLFGSQDNVRMPNVVL